MYAAIKNGIIQAISECNFEIEDCFTIKDESLTKNHIGEKYSKNNKLKIAVVSPYGSCCGIATYAENLLKEFKNLNIEFKIFAEKDDNLRFDDEAVIRCWERGKDIEELISKIKIYNPTICVINHEFGYFPRADIWLNLLFRLEEIPTVTIYHTISPLDKDKLIYYSASQNIIVHTEECKEKLREIGVNTDIKVVAHGCIEFNNIDKYWNIFKNEHVILQAGFGFSYKNVEDALRTVKILKNKYSDVFFIYLCSTSDKLKNIHFNYRNRLVELVKELDIEKNVAILMGFQHENVLNSYFRTIRGVCFFPYTSDKEHYVCGASGMVRYAMSNGGVCVVSDNKINHQFTELPLPKGNSPEEWNNIIDKVFSDYKYKEKILADSLNYVKENSWQKVSLQFISFFEEIAKNKF